MELDGRKSKILNAIIKNYLETGEPVGSRTISKDSELALSSATIRNEMADLEELGFIFQPHTSSGRIPTDKGYRLYVDNLMQEKKESLDQKEEKLFEKEKEIDEIKQYLVEKVDKVEDMLKKMARQLAINTNYTTMISTPHYKGNKLKFLQLSKVEENKILCVMVIEGNIIKNKMLTTSEKVDDENLLKLNLLLNTTITGLTLEQLNLAIISKLTGQAGEHISFVKEIIEAVTEAISDEKDLEIFTSGTTNIFKYPELSYDANKASDLICTFEEKEQLIEFINESFENEENTGIQIYIGEETPVQTMKDCSVVTATYELEDGVRGTIGIIGPKRMDYEKVVETLNTVKKQLDDVYKNHENNR